MLRRTTLYTALFGLTFLFLACIVTPAKGEDANDLSLSLGLTSDEPVATFRFPRPVSKIAENVTVITAPEIARLNAHTLAEVLNTVPGFQLDQLQTPGSAVFFSVLGVTSKHILVQMDGVPLNFISADNIAEIGNIPVQMIERVELIKGAASAAWGSALGGVINISTKSPATDRQFGGTASASIGDRATADLRAELSGTVNRFGYYLTGGNLRSDGLSVGNRTDLKHGFGKFSLDLPNRGKLTLGVEARQNSEGLEESASYDLRDTGDISYLNGYLALHYPLAERLTLELNGRGGRRQVAARQALLSAPVLLADPRVREIYQGAGLGLNWGDAETNLSAGLEYENNDIRQREPVRLAPDTNFDLSLERWSGYLNGTYSLGRLSILPGFRFDHTNLLENALSYTLGATFRLNDTTILRAYAARGYSMPVINNIEVLNGTRQLQNIWTLQTGIETSAIPYLWLKGTLFYNNIWKIQTIDRQLRAIVLHEQIKQGVDLEFRTSPLYGLALTGGYTYVDAWDKQTKAELTSSDNGPRQGFKLGLNYDNSAIGLRGALTGNYAEWYQPDLPPQDNAVIWDLHLTQKLFPREEMSPEFFFSVRNIFNDDQYQIDLHVNNPRWFEGGVRCHF
jgi:vitamin B12 transporter